MKFRFVGQLTAIVAFSLIVSCKKDKNDIAEEPAAQSVIDDSYSDNVRSVNLESINFNPAPTPIIFNSKAQGREVGGASPGINLSSSGWTHPSVLYFPKKWNGFYYWAALTPYPDIDSQYENPHIFCSNDGVSWIEPNGIFNPIEPCPPDKGFNSDVNLMLRDNTLYCYWRATETSKRAIYVRKSVDGINWEKKELVCNMPYGVVDVISPSFIRYQDKYYCYAVCGREEQQGAYFNAYSIRRMVSTDPEKFNPVKDNGFDLVKIAGRPWGFEQEPWHIEVKKIKNLWLMLVSTTNLNGYGSGGRLFFGYSTDGLTFTFNGKPICSVNGSTYKSSFNAKFDPTQKKLNVELWRSMMTHGWAVFHDYFSAKVYE